MKFCNTKLRWMVMVLGIMATGAQAAGHALHERAQAQRQAGVPGFTAGKSDYQILAGVTVVRAEAPAAGPGRRTASDELGRVGRYAIVPGTTAPATRSATRSPYLAVVNMRTGQPALLASQLKLYVEEGGKGPALAEALGGRLAHDGQVSRIVLVSFASHEAALAALPRARGLPGVRAAVPVVVDRFRRPH